MRHRSLRSAFVPNFIRLYLIWLIYLVEVWSLLSGRSVHYIPGGGVVSLEWEECTFFCLLIGVCSSVASLPCPMTPPSVTSSEGKSHEALSVTAL